jgi:hypothetical protein
MPTYHDTIPVPVRTVTPLSNGSATAARIQALGPGSIMVQATPTSTPPLPTEFGGALHLQGWVVSGFDTFRTLAEQYPGRITGAAWLWGYTESAGMQASVSHA